MKTSQEKALIKGKKYHVVYEHESGRNETKATYPTRKEAMEHKKGMRPKHRRWTSIIEG